MVLAANLAFTTSNPMTDLRQYINSDLVFNDLQFRLLSSEIATVNTFGGRYTQRSVVCIGFSDHLVVKPS